MTFHVGQRVVCVDDKFDETAKFWYSRLPLRNEVFTVRETVFCPATGAPGVLLEEITGVINPNFKLEQGFYAHRFRPVKQTSIDIFTAILTKAPETV